MRSLVWSGEFGNYTGVTFFESVPHLGSAGEHFGIRRAVEKWRRRAAYGGRKAAKARRVLKWLDVGEYEGDGFL
jgi:hypothetical protein